MNASQQVDTPMEYDNQNAYADQRDQRAQRREERRMRRAARPGDSWVGAAFLIGLGIFFLLNNLSIFYLENWWALFILLPALAAFGNAWRSYRDDQSLSAPVRANLIGGSILTIVAAIFLFNLNWTILGPLLLILAGIGLLINALLPG